ncbi:MAG: TfoX/Sxy family protein [Baekduia sp.]
MAYDEQLADRVRGLLVGEASVVEKKMFGGLAFLIGGHMAVAVSHSGGLLCRVDREDQEAALARPHTEPMVMKGRAMTGWIRVDAAGLAEDDDLQFWVDAGAEHARALPPK